MAADDPTLMAGSLTLDDAAAVVNADDTLVDPALAAEMAEEIRTLSRSVPPIAMPSAPPLRPVADATHLGFVGAALATAALFVGLLAVPQLMVRRDRTWVTPVTLTASDPRVVEVAEGLEKARTDRIALEDERDRLLARVHEIEALENPAELETALKTEITRQRAEQKRLQDTIDERDRLLIPPSSALGAKLKSTEQQIKALRAAKKGLSNESALTAEKQELNAKIAAVMRALRANDAHREALEALPFRTDVALAFVPEANLANVHAGTNLTACRWGMLLCADVGVVTQTFELGVDGSNPITGEPARGRFVAVAWTDAAGARRRMLFSR